MSSSLTPELKNEIERNQKLNPEQGQASFSYFLGCVESHFKMNSAMSKKYFIGMLKRANDFGITRQ